MENKINIAELLKNCSQGMELDCSMFENITFEEVITVRGFDDKKRVKIILSTHYSDGTKDEISLTEFGTYTDDETAKCVIFPKGKTTWEGFVPPCQFKDGDVIVDKYGAIAIYKQVHSFYEEPHADFYCGLSSKFRSFIIKTGEAQHCGKISSIRLATEEEKQELLQAIKDNGYKWDNENKTLEKLIKPEFKVGDKIKDTRNNSEGIIEKIDKENCTCLFNYGRFYFPITELDNFELVPNMEEINLDWCKQHGMTLSQVNVASDTSYYLETNGYIILVYTISTTGDQKLHVINPTTNKEIEFRVSRLNRDLNKLNSITTDDLRKLCELVNLNYPFKS